MKNNFFVFVLVLAVAFAGCSRAKKKMLNQINKIEKDVFADSTNALNLDKANLLIKSYTEFADKFPSEANAPDMLFKASEVAMNSGQGDLSVSIIEKLEKKYPENPKVATAMFLKGYVYENILKDTKKARLAYTEFIHKYPNHQLVNDAKACINNLGKSDEEIIKEFEAKIDNKL
ncbi:MAG: tetratricopeptide repeat protein [Bacteroidota bacterium]|nr:tetratricopeptide repeat protein [Bacteroidota bacterium]